MGLIKAPETPSFEVVCFVNEDEKNSPENQRQYHSSVGMLHYLVKQSHPGIVNAVRELSKVCGSIQENASNYQVYSGKQMFVTVEHIQGSEQQWKLIFIGDCDYGGDPDSRSGFILYVCDL